MHGELERYGDVQTILEEEYDIMTASIQSPKERNY